MGQSLQFQEPMGPAVTIQGLWRPTTSFFKAAEARSVIFKKKPLGRLHIRSHRAANYNFRAIGATKLHIKSHRADNYNLQRHWGQHSYSEPLGPKFIFKGHWGQRSFSRAIRATIHHFRIHRGQNHDSKEPLGPFTTILRAIGAKQ